MIDSAAGGACSLAPDCVAAVLRSWAESGREYTMPVVGSSMLPTIRSGDRLVLGHGGEGVGRGDVVAFHKHGGLVAHRVTHSWCGSDGRRLLTRGDNAEVWDAPIAESQVTGTVKAVWRGDRVLQLDGRVWRAAGWLVATGTAACGRVGRAHVLADRQVGRWHIRPGLALGRAARALARVALQTLVLATARPPAQTGGR